jgi:hypothetical protein
MQRLNASTLERFNAPHLTPDPNRIPQHLKTVPHDMDFALRGVPPFDRAIGDSKPEFLGEEENFDVEGETVDLLSGKDGLRRRAPEGFETALRVADAGHGKPAKDRVERLAHVAAEPALVQRDAALRVPSISKEHVNFRMRLKVLHESVHFTERDAQVCIHVENEFTSRRGYAGAHGKAFSVVPVICHDVQIRLAGRRLAGYLARPVCAGLHNDD